MVYRIYVEKKPGFDVEAGGLKNELTGLLGISGIKNVRILNRYDIEGISEELFRELRDTVFSEPPVDRTYMSLPEAKGTVFAVEYLPGQFDQRADSASQCIQLISQGERPAVRSARVYIIEKEDGFGELGEEELSQIKKYVINPVEAREADLSQKETLSLSYPEPKMVETLEGFNALTEEELSLFRQEKGLAMDDKDLLFCQKYFLSEKRDPTITEIRMIDTYWSDHCRHTTFGTILDECGFSDELVKKAFERYLDLRKETGREEKPICLMDMGTIGQKALKKRGILKNLDESEEINACTVKIKCDVDGVNEDWLFLFKNETHNHPTEIEPFGGAATCIGGAIRDPLSGRSYVYQAMRVTGASDPLVSVKDTLKGKLPQRKLVTTAAAGYSSYGNQIGLATGQVDEIYHPGYVAKRMEIGAVVGAAPAENVRRECPEAGDVIILLGGRTGRDGIGGATGSSKEHKTESLESCGAEVQKGNAPVERKLQRLFRRKDACRLIKRCNDFGAGGVSVAIGELADGLRIDLDKVTKKYEGLDGTELAISESQERMAVALSPSDIDMFLRIADEENLEARPVALVTEEKRLVMTWRGKEIVNISRDFLNSNGAEKHQKAFVLKGKEYKPSWEGQSISEKMHSLVKDLNISSRKGLSERFDSTIGAATVLMPFGGKYQLTPENAMVAFLPVDTKTSTVSGMSWGYNPFLMSLDEYRGARTAVVESVTKLTAAGFDYKDMYLTFQEYFERLRTDPERWGRPVGALLGALDAQMGLGIAAIGGKDSMSGSFENLDVPPTLVSFATAIGRVQNVKSAAFKESGNEILLISPEYEDWVLSSLESQKKVYEKVLELNRTGEVLSMMSIGYGGIAEALFKMGLGNHIGIKLDTEEDIFGLRYGSLILEVKSPVAKGKFDGGEIIRLGETVESYLFSVNGEEVSMDGLQEDWEKRLESVYPYRKKGDSAETVNSSLTSPSQGPRIHIGRPRAVIPVFPGTNCEYDTARAFKRAGADAEVLVIRNITPQAVTESIERLVKAIDESQILMLPGGFSGGDEPDGSAKFIASFFRNPYVTEAVRRLLKERDGLCLGICNGFQALIKLGLLPYGDITPITEKSPTLTFNTLGRHQSMLVNTRISSSGSPWLSKCRVGDIHTVAISHGEGRFVGDRGLIEELIKKGQVATQYVDLNGVPSMDLKYNPNGSLYAIEGITSPDGRVFGKMGHTERSGEGLYLNVPGNLYQPIFEGGVDYFRI